MPIIKYLFLLSLGIVIGLSFVGVGVGQEHDYPALDSANVFTNTNQFTSGATVGPIASSALSGYAAPNGTLVGCTDCILPSNPCVGGGSGAIAMRVNGAWNCSAGSSTVGTGLPVLNVTANGALGNGVHDDTAAINTTIASCPQASPSIGCIIYFPAGLYLTSSTLTVGLTKGVHFLGSGTCGTGGCASIIQTNGAYWGATVGNGTTPNSSGLLWENIGFQDLTGTGLGGVDLLATRDAMFMNVSCLNYSVGTCFELDGGINFTQFIHLYNIYSWKTKYRFQTNNLTASNFVWGGEGNCQNSAATDVITGSIDLDLGFTHHLASTGTASEWSVDTQAQNCQTGIALWNAGGNHFWGKADEITVQARPNQSFGVIVDGDTSSIANGNFFNGVQVTKAGTAFYLKPNTANTTILGPIFNGTNGVDLVVDSGVLATTRILTNKRLTGWQTNISDIARNANVVTAHTTANSDNGDLSIVPGTLLTAFNVTGGATNFNGTFPVATVGTNDTTGVTTLTWSQTGPNESGTINSSACGGSGSCVAPLSTIVTAGVGQVEITGDQLTQDLLLSQPSLPNQSTFPLNAFGGTARIFFDGQRTSINENGSGLVHLVSGFTVTYNGAAANSYTPQPTTISLGGNGTVNTSGTGPSTVTWQSGTLYKQAWVGAQITVNNVAYSVTAVNNNLTVLTVSGNTGTQTGVNFNTSGIAGVPPCANPLGGVCQSSDDKKHIVFTNTNGSTLCLPPPGAVNGYPPSYTFSIEYEPGTLVPQFASVTPPGQTSNYGIACLGVAAQLRGSSNLVNIGFNQGVSIYTDGTNWFAISGMATTGTGAGTTNTIPIWTSPSTLGNSPLTSAGASITNPNQFNLTGTGLTSQVGANQPALLISEVIGSASTACNATNWSLTTNPFPGCSGIFVSTGPSNNGGTMGYVASTIANLNFGSGTPALPNVGVGLLGSATIGALSSNNMGDVRGVYGLGTNAGAGTVTSLTGVYGQTTNFSGGSSPTNMRALYAINAFQASATNAYGLYVDSPSIQNALTLTHNYGIFVADQTIAGSGTNSDPHGIYVQGGGIQTAAHTFSTLPTCVAGLEGRMEAVTDSTTATWGATITGSSTNHVLAYCDGTNWTVAAK